MKIDLLLLAVFVIIFFPDFETEVLWGWVSKEHRSVSRTPENIYVGY